MERHELKLVDPKVDTSSGSRLPAGLAGLLVLAAAGLASWVGADTARQQVPAPAMADRALQLSLDEGRGHPEVVETLQLLRATLGRRPLDSRTRTAYASLLLALATSTNETRAAAFHARVAAELSPVTVPVVRTSVLVLTRSGEFDAAIEQIRRMFDYDSSAAAQLLGRVSPLLFEPQIEAALGDAPEARLAWSEQLRTSQRLEQADTVVLRTLERYPDHWPTREAAARIAVRREQPDLLLQLFPERLEIPRSQGHALLHTYAARAQWRRGEGETARQTLQTALELGQGERRVQVVAGDTYAAMGEAEAARTVWNRALFGLPSRAVETRIQILSRLARLEQRHGQPGTALRLWREILGLDPQQPEATERVRNLSPS